MKKMVPALGMLMVSASMLATSTYAWFTMNDTVTVTGMELKTKVSGNLLICDDNMENSYSTALSQSVKGILEPVSSVTGQTDSFFYTVAAKANGDAIEDKYVDYDVTGLGAATAATWGNKFSEDYNVSTEKAGTMIQGETLAKGYVDYVFFLKATSDSANQSIYMTDCNLLYNNAAIDDAAKAAVDKDNAWRVAVFVSPIDAAIGGKGTSDTAAAAGTLDPAASTAKNILTRTGAANQESTYAVSATNQAPSEAAVYNSWANDGKLATIATAGNTAYYKVTVRVWLEGEDTSCKSSTYALLTNQYQLAAEFKLADTATPVANILSDANGTKAPAAPAQPTPDPEQP